MAARVRCRVQLSHFHRLVLGLGHRVRSPQSGFDGGATGPPRVNALGLLVQPGMNCGHHISSLSAFERSKGRLSRVYSKLWDSGKRISYPGQDPAAHQRCYYLLESPYKSV